VEPRSEKRAAATSEATAIVGDVAVESRAQRGEEQRLWKPLLVTWPWNPEPREERNSGLVTWSWNPEAERRAAAAPTAAAVVGDMVKRREQHGSSLTKVSSDST
jgi:hypothetical protein